MTLKRKPLTFINPTASTTVVLYIENFSLKTIFQENRSLKSSNYICSLQY